MTKNLLVLTTAGRLRWLKGAVDTLRDPLEVFVVDDSTPREIGIRNFCQTKGIKFLTKSKPKGLTDSWNLAHQFFQRGNYENCILSNDDVRFPAGFSTELFRGLQSFDVTVPVSNGPGHSHSQRLPSSLLGRATPENLDQIQKKLRLIYRNASFEQLSFFNGFCFAFSKTIRKFAFSDILLCNSKLINVGNEDDLNARIQNGKGKVGVCRSSFVFHYKKGTYRQLRLKHRNQLWR